MDDILVLVITAVFILISIYGRKNKKRSIPVPEKAEIPDQNDPFHDFPGGDDDFEKIIIKRDLKSTTAKKSVFPMGMSDNSDLIAREGQRVQRTIFPISSLKEKKVVHKEKMKFSLKKAVIYSEILNRKYN